MFDSSLDLVCVPVIGVGGIYTAARASEHWWLNINELCGLPVHSLYVACRHKVTCLLI